MSEHVSDSAEWQAVQSHAEKFSGVHLRDLFDSDPRRGERLAAQVADLYVDYSKNLVTDEVLTALVGATPFALFPTLQAAALPARGAVVHGLLLLAAGVLLSLPWRALRLRRPHAPRAAAQEPALAADDLEREMVTTRGA